MLLQDSLTERFSGSDRFQVLAEFTCPAGRAPARLLEFLEDYENDPSLPPGFGVFGVTVTQNPSGTVTASPTDVIALVNQAGGLKGLEYVPHVSAKGMNREEIESFLQGLQLQGARFCFVVTGDKPVAGKPVFDLDSLNTLQLIQRMNADAVVDADPGTPVPCLTAGAAVGLSKYEEGTCLQQLIKLEKKIRLGGAAFVITNLIFDSRKVRDFFRYLRERDLNLPVFGNVFFLTEPAARRMRDEKLPGVYISPALYQKVSQESQDDYIRRAAQQVDMWRSLGAFGVHLGNVEDLGLLKRILGEAQELRESWESHDENITFPPPGEKLFYVYTEQGEPTPLRPPEIPAARRLMGGVHELFFEAGATGFEAARYLFRHSRGLQSGSGVIYNAVRFAEFFGKSSLVRCQGCGDCFLPENYYVCPVGECAKGLTNIPCGDSTVDGKCGVDPSRPCAAALIYDAARYFQGDTSSLRRGVNPPRDPALVQTSSFRSFFLGMDHRRPSSLIEVAELLHSSIPRVRKAYGIVKEQGFDRASTGVHYLRAIVTAQALRAPSYIDINVDDAGEGQSDTACALMRGSVRLVEENGLGIPPCIDSSDPLVIRAGLEEFYRLRRDGPPPLVNSANAERRHFVWEMTAIGAFNIVYMVMDGAGSSCSRVEEMEQQALDFFREARSHGFQPRQIFFDTTVIPLAMEFSRFKEPGFNWVSLQLLRRLMSNRQMAGVNSILGVTNLIRDFPQGRKIGLLRAFLQIAQEAGLTAAIVDVRREFGRKSPEDQEIVEIVRAFVEQDGSDASYDRMCRAYELYKGYGGRPAAAP